MDKELTLVRMQKFVRRLGRGGLRLGRRRSWSLRSRAGRRLLRARKAHRTHADRNQSDEESKATLQLAPSGFIRHEMFVVPGHAETL